MNKMQWGFYFDQTRCCGCLACVVACKQWHQSQTNWRKVNTIERGEFPNVRVAFLALSCCHCLFPFCMDVCPPGAIWKCEEYGAVLVRQEECLGKDRCGLCADACPYGIPSFGDGPDAKMEKCDLCWERIKGGDEPLCVIACPSRALDVGPLEELKSRYGARFEVDGFVPNSNIVPSLIFRSTLLQPHQETS